jgi:hypothetical protein
LTLLLFASNQSVGAAAGIVDESSDFVQFDVPPVVVSTTTARVVRFEQRRCDFDLRVLGQIDSELETGIETRRQDDGSGRLDVRNITEAGAEIEWESPCELVRVAKVTAFVLSIAPVKRNRVVVDRSSAIFLRTR